MIPQSKGNGGQTQIRCFRDLTLIGVTQSPFPLERRAPVGKGDHLRST